MSVLFHFLWSCGHDKALTYTFLAHCQRNEGNARLSCASQLCCRASSSEHEMFWKEHWQWVLQIYMSPSGEHSSIYGERTGFNFHFIWKLNSFILLLQAIPERKQTVKKFLNQGIFIPSHPATTWFNCWVCKNSKCFPLPKNTTSLSIFLLKLLRYSLSVCLLTLALDSYATLWLWFWA